MERMLFAETAVLVEFESVGVVFLVLHIVIVALLALSAGKSYACSHKLQPP